MGIRLVVGLGNPGDRYRDTRHNVGFMLVERLAEGSAWRPWKDLGEYADVGRGGVGARFLCAKPLTYMNDSGRMARDLAAFHKIRPDELLTCFDDVALPVGRIRVRARGSSGGQKGMQSILAELGTEEVPRLRVGIGPLPPGRDPKGFVLERFTRPDRAELEKVLSERAVPAALLAVTEGVEAAMNRYNAPQEEA